jgi:hypothetical protein
MWNQPKEINKENKINKKLIFLLNLFKKFPCWGQGNIKGNKFHFLYNKLKDMDPKKNGNPNTESDDENPGKISS